ncbi:melibiase [Colletotrichum graminicola]|uniref:Alpha-galactosidase n=1 Tax=Colletotrichum graminicola (strain M1.001 / M2 / FGSC 10212) TaxID=645133 RepID=E3QSA4_COLGM|nr:melibiase [Colletotrichum graminicola M1.001]EFQ33731.1 melibiase [Colletotrichum graminicola M1.001]WDK20995.1 melibiase [Colletotrichum graminicola]
MVYRSLGLVAAIASAGRVAALNNGLAITPPMGWNNWNAFACDVSEDLILSTSERVISLGLRDLGYDHVVLDDCWQDENGRDAQGKIHPNLAKFPNGLKHVSDQLHAQGLKYGMYSSAGEMTCARFAGSLDHEKEDAENFASWGVDFLKYDNCYHMGRMGTPKISFDRFKVMADALNATGRPIALNLCNWGEDYVHTWGMSIAHAWRMSGDIYDSFTRPDDLCSCTTAADPFCVAPGTHCSVLFILNRVAAFADRSIPGGWNDLDMLEVGQGGMTDEEYKAHFALWAALKSPLMLGNDLRDMPAEALSIVNNPAIIALNQDPHGRSVLRVRRDVGGVLTPDEYGVAETQVWSGRLENGDQAVIFLNAAGAEVEMESSLAEIFVSDGPGGAAPQVKSKWAIHDLWADRMSTEMAESLFAADSHGSRVKILQKANWYNATEIPYAVGLEKEDPRLFGRKVGEVEAKGVLKTKVPSHAAKVFRLRRIATPGDGFKTKSHDRTQRVVKEEL